ncbi:MAG: hypothetical protein WBA74_17790 [Cyclobacteriaceae bacterium]
MEISADIRSLGTLEFLLSDSKNTHSTIAEFTYLVNTLQSKRDKFPSDRQFLQHVYRFVHRKSLKKYKKYVTLEETLSKPGYYDCLTGTLLYSLILDELGFDITIREFNYHVLLIVSLDKHKILIESTDPVNGFVVGEQAIAQRIADYKEEDASKKRYSVYGFTKAIDKEISVAQLVGLHFYNQAISYLNNLDMKGALPNISKAYALYPCERIREISKLINTDRLKGLLATSD